MDSPDCRPPCRELTELKQSYDHFRDDTVRRLGAGDVTMAAINVKLNWLIGMLSAIGAAMLTVVLKVLFT